MNAKRKTAQINSIDNLLHYIVNCEILVQIFNGRNLFVRSWNANGKKMKRINLAIAIEIRILNEKSQRAGFSLDIFSFIRRSLLFSFDGSVTLFFLQYFLREIRRNWFLYHFKKLLRVNYYVFSWKHFY